MIQILEFLEKNCISLSLAPTKILKKKFELENTVPVLDYGILRKCELTHRTNKSISFLLGLVKSLSNIPEVNKLEN